MERLFNSLKAVSLDPGLTAEDVRALLNKTAEANGMTTDAHCRLMITRGRKAKPFQHPKLSSPISQYHLFLFSLIRFLVRVVAFRVRDEA